MPGARARRWADHPAGCCHALAANLPPPHPTPPHPSTLDPCSYPSDDINKFLWMVRIGGGVFPEIKEPNYLAADGERAGPLGAGWLVVWAVGPWSGRLAGCGLLS